MQVYLNVHKKYEAIQKQLFYMIPEKWDRVYLYACVVDHFQDLQTGEMFFYYFPKSMIRKNPVNVYEVPNKFNIDEKAYLKLAEKLYDEIKELRKECIKMGEKPWSNITIFVEDLKFHVEYHYDDLRYSEYTSLDRHLIWRHQYLHVPLSSYSKKERNMIEEYLKQEKHIHKPMTYQEGIYKKPVSNITEFRKIDDNVNINRNVGVDAHIDPNHVNSKKKDKTVGGGAHIDLQNKKFKIKNQKEIEEEPTVKSQILTIQ